MYIHTYVYMYICVYMYIYVCKYIFVYIYTCTYIYTHIYTLVHTCSHACVLICMHSLCKRRTLPTVGAVGVCSRSQKKFDYLCQFQTVNVCLANTCEPSLKAVIS